MPSFRVQTTVVEQLFSKQDEGVAERMELTDSEAELLAKILDRGFSPTPALRKALSRLADPKRQPPRLHWKESKGGEARSQTSP